jgi:hypothetical protein
MTKREFFESCDFNNLDLRKQITASIDAIDYNTSNKNDNDLVVKVTLSEDGKTWTRANDELRELNLNLMNDYPMFEIILLKYKSMFREPGFTLDKLYSVILPIWTQKHRSKQLDKLYGDK